MTLLTKLRYKMKVKDVQIGQEVNSILKGIGIVTKKTPLKH